MEENREDALRRYFSIISVVFFTIYIICMMISLFSVSVPTPVCICLIFVAFFLLIIQDDVSTKIEELGGVDKRGFLSFSFFTTLILLCYIVMAYYLQIELLDEILWLNIGLYDSDLLDQSLRALHKLKQDEG